jgi:hypothetical protein
VDIWAVQKPVKEVAWSFSDHFEDELWLEFNFETLDVELNRVKFYKSKTAEAFPVSSLGSRAAHFWASIVLKPTKSNSNSRSHPTTLTLSTITQV